MSTHSIYVFWCLAMLFVRFAFIVRSDPIYKCMNDLCACEIEIMRDRKA